MINWRNVDMTEHIRQSNLIENIADEAEVLQSIRAWVWLMERSQLTHQVIKQTQLTITANQGGLRPDQRGHYRDVSCTNVRVGAYLPPPWSMVANLMDDWLTGHADRSPWINHVYYEGIHPFADGNGRSGRMFMWRQQILEGREPTLFQAKDRFQYYRDLDWYRLVHATELRFGSGVPDAGV